jgi:hypothetical protein
VSPIFGLANCSFAAMIKHPPLFEPERKIWLLNEDAVTLGLLTQLCHQVQKGVAARSVRTRRTGGVHAINVVFATEKTQ